MGAGVGGKYVIGDSNATWVGVLNHYRSGTFANGMHKTPCRFGVIHIEVRHFLATMLLRAVPPAALAGGGVTRAHLMRILAVTKNLFTLQFNREGFGKFRRCVGSFALGRHARIEPRKNFCVVGRGMRECIASQLRPRCLRQRTARLQFRND
ncbi:unannotated protein [freshwater metagenome]|uniref:Unannotated protein n=1 Tax=freshwater metagenome TaxID=449393 RepID=A0A6J6DRR0_9ZZZZ